MAIITHTTRVLVPNRVMIVSWVGLANGDSGEPIEFVDYSDRSAHVFGTFGAGGTLILEGSNDAGVTYTGLTDPQGNAISYDAAKVEAVVELLEKMRPRVTAGDGTTSIAVHMLIKTP